MISKIKTCIVLAIFIAVPFSQTRAQSAPSPVVLELFTSQACAFCPPADELLGRMAGKPGIIALSCHVDYFGVRQNSLGKSFCTQRQNNYGRLIGHGPRYTPELVVNGHTDMIGYEAEKISAAIMKARAEKIVPIAVTPYGAGNYTITVPTGRIAEETHLLLAVYDRPHTMAITEGNNLGKRIVYHNVVSKMSDLGPWDGTAITRTVMPGFDVNSAGFAVFAQNLQTGQIVAAGQASR